ncbi:16S rRNA (adenine(1518)-N(6)/adenine(1519)-N(6))-dimethyltransferase RsmA [Phycisphaerales bacterium AB-hyl4]|uniref:Ribosomal RNA small subunit methyltransferase A n=1 Tax=Natronomicrosphaera hydrolytica TaxID=3242702 RepID=A0ABV4U6M9_9BACT
MQTLTQIKQLLAAHGLRPKHRLGQNFLHDHNQMRKILAAAELSPGDRVLEVGPGTGTLSEALLEAGAHLVAVELDTDLEPILRERLAPFGDRAHLVVGDILASKRQLNPDVIDALQASSPKPQAPNPKPQASSFKLIANLPYNIASPLLINLAADHPAMTLAVVMVQREVADRLLAKPGGKQYGPLTVMVQAMCEVQRVSVLPPGCFWPPPKVDSSVIRLRRRATPMTDDPPRLADLLHRVFGQRRKQLGSVLGRSTALPPGIAGTDRPETLSVEQLIELARSL